MRIGPFCRRFSVPLPRRKIDSEQQQIIRETLSDHKYSGGKDVVLRHHFDTFLSRHEDGKCKILHLDGLFRRIYGDLRESYQNNEEYNGDLSINLWKERVNNGQVRLSPEQQEIFDAATSPDRPNIFFTGHAGTGKSFLLRAIIERLVDIELKQNRDLNSGSIAVTSTTGISACAIGGTTLHSWAGFGHQLVKMSPERVFRYLNSMEKTQVAKRWKSVKTLIIDECSMLSPSLLDLIEYLGRKFRKNIDVDSYKKPFGGIQVILSGDFLQLPPIESSIKEQVELYRKQLIEKKKNEILEKNWIRSCDTVPSTLQDFVLGETELRRINGQAWKKFENSRKELKFCFDAKSWMYFKGVGCQSKTRPMIYQLVKPYRHEKDPLFTEFLNIVRVGKYHHCEKTLRLVDAMFRHLEMPFEQRPRDFLFYQIANGKLSSMEELEKYLEICPSTNENYFKHHSDIIVDESTEAHRYLTRLADPDNEPVRLFSQRKESEATNNFRLSLLESTLTMSYIASNLAVNESSLPDLLHLKVGARVMLMKNIAPQVGLVNGVVGTVTGFQNVQIDRRNPDSIFTLPIVKFPLLNGKILYDDGKRSEFFQTDSNSVSLTILPSVETKLDLEESTSDKIVTQPVKLQLPLTLAWCYSIHKSQGQTLQKIQVDLGKLFAHGQLYVALSRTSTLCNLRVTGYTDAVLKWTRHRKVAEFYKQFSTSDSEELKID